MALNDYPQKNFASTPYRLVSKDYEFLFHLMSSKSSIVSTLEYYSFSQGWIQLEVEEGHPTKRFAKIEWKLSSPSTREGFWTLLI